MDNYIKVKINGKENVWAEPISGNKVIIKNIPFGRGPSLDDVVEYEERDGFKHVTKIVEKKSVAFSIRYSEEGDVHKNWKDLSKYLQSKNVEVEGFMPGYGAIAVKPTTMVSELEFIVNESPVQFSIEL